jgi:hypothetical protein
MPGTERVIAFSQLAVKGLKTICVFGVIEKKVMKYYTSSF